MGGGDELVLWFLLSLAHAHCQAEYSGGQRGIGSSSESSLSEHKAPPKGEGHRGGSGLTVGWVGGTAGNTERPGVGDDGHGQRNGEETQSGA